MIRFSLFALLMLGSILHASEPAKDKRINVAVFDFSSNGLQEAEVRTLTDKLRSSLYTTGKFTMVERGMMESILNEQGFQQTGCTSEECMVEAGQLLGVEQMVLGSVGKVGNVFLLTARLVDVGTGAILKNISFESRGAVEKLLLRGIPKLAKSLAGAEGHVESPGAGTIATSIFANIVDNVSNVLGVNSNKKPPPDIATSPDFSGAYLNQDDKVIRGFHFFQDNTFRFLKVAKLQHLEARRYLALGCPSGKCLEGVYQNRGGVLEFKLGRELIRCYVQGDNLVMKRGSRRDYHFVADENFEEKGPATHGIYVAQKGRTIRGIRFFPDNTYRFLLSGRHELDKARKQLSSGCSKGECLQGLYQKKNGIVQFVIQDEKVECFFMEDRLKMIFPGRKGLNKSREYLFTAD